MVSNSSRERTICELDKVGRTEWKCCMLLINLKIGKVHSIGGGRGAGTEKEIQFIKYAL